MRPVLWIAIHLPSLSLESFTATLAAAPAGDAGSAGPAGVPPPVALLDAHRIAAANAAARALGVKPGLKRATALALAPRIVLGQADARRDAEALLPVAHAALAFTPMVCLHEGRNGAAADTVLLEVQASLRCFGGLEKLLARIDAALAPFGHAVRVACAATPRAAAVLVRADAESSAAASPPRCLDLESTRAALRTVPVWLFGPGREHWDALQGMGLRVLGDLLGLPRAGLARRFGEVLLDEIDTALGRRPDPREPIVLPPAFESRLELFARADTTEQVLHGAFVLLERLIAWLAAQHAFVRRFRLAMRHEPRWQQSARTPEATAVEVALAEPSRDSRHLLALLRERLAWTKLPAPTIEISLQAEDISRRPPPNAELFATVQSEHEGLVRLVERLQARLGSERVQHLAAAADHRPERASVLVVAEPGRLSSARAVSREVATAPRPVWLQAPAPLAEASSQPLLDGRPLQLLSGPERIEGGWWDGGLAGRDYFIAEAGDGALVWVYRERLPLSEADRASGWYLHGRFG